MDWEWFDSHRDKQASLLGGKIFCGISSNTEPIDRNSRAESGMILTWVVSGKGVLTVSGKDYPIEPSSIILRHQDMEYRLRLFSRTKHRRCYFGISDELFRLFKEIHPNILLIPPVFRIGENVNHLENFLMLYATMQSTPAEELLSALPSFERYILHYLSPFLSEGRINALNEARKMLETDFSSPLEEIAARAGMGYSSFRKEFSKAYGETPHQYRLEKRTEKAKQLLSMGRTCSETADELGYTDIYTFSHQFTKIAGIPPRQYRRKHLF